MGRTGGPCRKNQLPLRSCRSSSSKRPVETARKHTNPTRDLSLKPHTVSDVVSTWQLRLSGQGVARALTDRSISSWRSRTFQSPPALFASSEALVKASNLASKQRVLTQPENIHEEHLYQTNGILNLLVLKRVVGRLRWESLNFGPGPLSRVQVPS
jgi:hypothetical protein